MITNKNAEHTNKNEMEVCKEKIIDLLEHSKSIDTLNRVYRLLTYLYVRE